MLNLRIVTVSTDHGVGIYIDRMAKDGYNNNIVNLSDEHTNYDVPFKMFFLPTSSSPNTTYTGTLVATGGWEFSLELCLICANVHCHLIIVILP